TRLMLAKSYYKLGDYAKAEVVCKFFFTRHATSAYLDDMHHLLGNVYFRMKNYTAAVEQWLWVVDNGRDARLKRLASSYLYNTLYHFLKTPEIKALQRRLVSPTLDGFVTVLEASRLLEEGEQSRAESLLRTFLRDQPNHPYADEARRLAGISIPEVGKGVNILYLKSTDGELKEVAEDIEAGLEYALLEYKRRNPRDDLHLRTVEVGGSVISALKTATQQLRSSRPLCMLGPIDPDQTASLAMLSRYERFPYIAPLSSQTGLAALSPYTFQINPDARVKGRFLGEYATAQLGARRLAVLAPATEYGEDFVQSFVEEVQAGGGDILTVQWYYESAEDFRRQFSAMRRQAFWVTYQDSVLAENPDISEEDLKAGFEEYMEWLFDPARIGIRADSMDVPAYGLDAVLIVIPSPDMIRFVAPHFALSNLKTTLLGNEGWNDPELLQKHRQYIDGLVYITAGYYDPNSTDYRVFLNRFRSEMKTTPELFHLLGYDIMKWILSNYTPGISATELRDRLERTNRFQGLMENIHFSDKPRVNSTLTVLKFHLGQIIRLN
ncbi:MAG: hypothetical protein D6681_22535, partial [Calditrichaeota bacterium]